MTHSLNHHLPPGCKTSWHGSQCFRDLVKRKLISDLSNEGQMTDIYKNNNWKPTTMLAFSDSTEMLLEHLMHSSHPPCDVSKMDLSQYV